MKEKNNIIPIITDPLGKSWDQPKIENILIDDKNALMEENDFKELHEYSCSVPTGVYVGKMWKSRINEKWYLRWFSEHENPEFVSNNVREIIIIA